jgi:hypothetical protein
MRNKSITIGVMAMVITAAFATRIVAQHDEHHAEQAAKPQAQTGATKATTENSGQQGMTGGGTMAGKAGMMSNGMMGMMKGQNQQMSDAIKKMMENMTALQNENEPAKMKSMMAEQQNMMQQMRDQMMKQGGVMEMMSGMMQNCPMMGGKGQEKIPNTPSH